MGSSPAQLEGARPRADAGAVSWLAASLLSAWPLCAYLHNLMNSYSTLSKPSSRSLLETFAGIAKRTGKEEKGFAATRWCYSSYLSSLEVVVKLLFSLQRCCRRHGGRGGGGGDDGGGDGGDGGDDGHGCDGSGHVCLLLLLLLLPLLWLVLLLLSSWQLLSDQSVPLFFQGQPQQV